MSHITTVDGDARDRGPRGGPRHWARAIVVALVRSAKHLYANDGGEWAAALAYYGLLSAFPLLLMGGAVASHFVEPAWAVDRATVLLGEFLPQGEQQVEQIVNGAVAERDRISLLSGVALFWTGSRVFAALAKALNALRGTDDQADAPRRVLVSFVMLLGIGLVFLLALASGALINLAWDALRFVPNERLEVLQVVRHTVRTVLLLVAFALIYQFVPRGRQDWRAVLIGAATAPLLFLAARELFLFTLRQSANYQLIYGPLAIAAVLMLWAWLVGLITLFGGKLAANGRALLAECGIGSKQGRRAARRGPAWPRSEKTDAPTIERNCPRSPAEDASTLVAAGRLTEAAPDAGDASAR